MAGRGRLRGGNPSVGALGGKRAFGRVPLSAVPPQPQPTKLRAPGGSRAQGSFTCRTKEIVISGPACAARAWHGEGLELRPQPCPPALGVLQGKPAPVNSSGGLAVSTLACPQEGSEKHLGAVCPSSLSRDQAL